MSKNKTNWDHCAHCGVMSNLKKCARCKEISCMYIMVCGYLFRFCYFDVLSHDVIIYVSQIPYALSPNIEYHYYFQTAVNNVRSMDGR